MSGNSFSQWFEKVQQEEADQNQPLSDGGTQSMWGGFLNFGDGASEKKSEPGDLESGQALLSDPSTWMNALPSFKANEQLQSSQKEANVFGLSYQTRFKWFVSSILLAVFFFSMAFTVGLPVIVLRPHKFAFCFTVGSVLFMSSFSLLVGPASHLKTLFSSERLLVTVAYLVSMLATLWASLVVRSYILVMATSSAQFACLGYYLMSYIPGGAIGMRVFVGMFTKFTRLIIGPCLSAMMLMCKGCLKIVSS